jgi:hypothetical protein
MFARAFVYLLPRQLTGVFVLDVSVDHALVDIGQTFDFNKLRFEVEKASLNGEEVIWEVRLIRLP